MDWILASASPRRKELLQQLIPTFEIIPATAEEQVTGNPTPAELVVMLAKQKALEIAQTTQAEGKAVLGADTVVAVDGEVLGKPKDEQDAVRMLTRLSGRTHEVYTGVCIVYTDKEGVKKVTDFARTEVLFYALTQRQILD